MENVNDLFDKLKVGECITISLEDKLSVCKISENELALNVNGATIDKIKR